MGHVPSLGPVHRFYDGVLSGVIVASPHIQRLAEEAGDAVPEEVRVNYVGTPMDLMRVAAFFQLDLCSPGDPETGDPMVFADDNGSFVTIQRVDRASDVLGTIAKVAQEADLPLPPWLAGPGIA